MKFIFPVVDEKVINDEPQSYHSGRLFFMTLPYFSENGLKGVSFTMPWRESKFPDYCKPQDLGEEYFMSRQWGRSLGEYEEKVVK
jgi:hypothetical protein